MRFEETNFASSKIFTMVVYDRNILILVNIILALVSALNTPPVDNFLFFVVYFLWSQSLRTLSRGTPAALKYFLGGSLFDKIIMSSSFAAGRCGISGVS